MYLSANRSAFSCPQFCALSYALACAFEESDFYYCSDYYSFSDYCCSDRRPNPIPEQHRSAHSHSHCHSHHLESHLEESHHLESHLEVLLLPGESDALWWNE